MSLRKSGLQKDVLALYRRFEVCITSMKLMLITPSQGVADGQHEAFSDQTQISYLYPIHFPHERYKHFPA